MYKRQVLGKGILGSVLAIGIFMIPTFSRLVYSMVLENKQRLYVKAAQSLSLIHI